MYRFKQDGISIEVCGNKAIVEYNNLAVVMDVRRKESIEKGLKVFPEKFREFVKKHLKNAKVL